MIRFYLVLMLRLRKNKIIVWLGQFRWKKLKMFYFKLIFQNHWVQWYSISFFFFRIIDILCTVMSFILLNVFSSWNFSTTINSTHLVLTWKVDTLKTMSYLRSISLCNIIYKIIVNGIVKMLSQGWLVLIKVLFPSSLIFWQYFGGSQASPHPKYKKLGKS